MSSAVMIWPFKSARLLSFVDFPSASCQAPRKSSIDSFTLSVLSVANNGEMVGVFYALR